MMCPKYSTWGCPKTHLFHLPYSLFALKISRTSSTCMLCSSKLELYMRMSSKNTKTNFLRYGDSNLFMSS
uniref:Uncharacterized protein n=1 Tax=Arundo donax TaxID=35708 RepID=A0A0A9AKI5_ARUDO